MKHLDRSNLRYPGLWKGCMRAVETALGPTGLMLHGKSVNRTNGTFSVIDGSNWRIMPGYGYMIRVGESAVNTHRISFPVESSVTRNRNQVTLSAWCMASGFVNYGSVFQEATGTSSWRLAIGYRSTGAVVVGARSEAGEAFREWRTTATYSTGLLHHLAARINVETDSVEIFVNGVNMPLAATSTFTQSQFADIDPTSSVMGGTGSGANAEYFNGHLGGQMHYGRLLPDSSIVLLSRRPGIAYETAHRRSYKSAAATTTIFRRSLVNRTGSRGIQ